MTGNNTQGELDDRLARALLEAGTPPARALVIRRVVDRLASVVDAVPNASDTERDSLLFLLEAADEHCWRLGAFSPQ